MSRLFLLLLRKEYTEFVRNKVHLLLFMLAVIAIAFVPVPLTISGKQIIPDSSRMGTIIMITALILIHLYVYDSCVTDFTSGGTIFLINLKAGVLQSVSAKSFVSVSIGILLCLAGGKHLIHTIHLSSIPWMILFFIFVSSITYVTTIVLGKSNTLIYLSDMLIGAGMLLAISKYTNPFWKCGVLLVPLTAVTVLLPFAFKLKRFRTLLK